MGDGRFSPSSLTVEPEDWWCCWVCVVDPVKDLAQDLGSGAIKTLFSFDQSNLACANQGVQAKVFSDLLDANLDIEECLILKILHQFI